MESLSIEENLEVKSNKDQKLLNNYTSLIEAIGFCDKTWMIFSVANLLQFLWGCEVSVIALYLEKLGNYFNIKQSIISLSVCLLYSMLGLGSIMVGTISKYYARKPCLLISTIVYFLFTFSCSFLSNFYVIVLFRCISNISIGIFNILALNLLCEYLPISSRSYYLMFDSGFYNVGTLWAVLVKICFPQNDTFSFATYKIVNMITCLPSLIGVGLILWKTTESPLYLMAKSNKYDEAFKLLAEMGRSKNIELTEDVKKDLKKEVIRKKNFKLKSNYSELFYPEYRNLTLLCLLINSICYLNMIGISYLVPKMIQDSQAKQFLSENVQLIIFALIQIPNGPIGGLMTESHFFGRRKTIIVSSFFCAVFYVCIYINRINLCYYSGVIMFFNSIAFGCAFIYVSEVFPTNIRDQAQSFIQFLSFIFGSWSPYFIDYIGKSNLVNNNLYLGASCLLCILLSVILPLDTLNRPLDDDL